MPSCEDGVVGAAAVPRAAAWPVLLCRHTNHTANADSAL